MPAFCLRPHPLVCCLAIALGLGASLAHASDEHPAAAPAKIVLEKPAIPTAAVAVQRPKPAEKPAEKPAAGDPQQVVDRIRNALAKHSDQDKMHVLVGDDPIMPKTQTAERAVAAVAPKPGSAHGTVKAHDYAKARAAAIAGHEAPSIQGGEVHWEYTGEHGPEHWGELKPEFNACAIGQRQTPIHIQAVDAVPGPVEPIEFHYGAGGGSVVNNGHTVQVDPTGRNWIKVRGSVYQLVQFHFHHPAEEKINHKGFAMVAHLVHKNDAGQLAVVAVLLDPGADNAFLNRIWTHMPLDRNDRVPLPDEQIDLNELLPQDQRYYQFMGSLTTPPCSEGVLWMVLKQPVTVGADQLRLFSKLFPMNARPTQAVNGRLVREGT